MDVVLKDFKTGWFEVQIEMTQEDIDRMIRSLNNLKRSVPSAHFHCSNNYKGSSGVAELEISLVPSTQKGSFSILELQQPETRLPD